MSVLVGTKYNKATIDESYDAIVIGSGMSGLTAAALMSRAGRRVLVLERHYTAGGFTHSYLRKGFEWDVGVHYIGEVHKRLSPMRQAFDLITEGRLQWAHMGEVTDSIIMGDERFDYRKGRRRVRADLIERFPDEVKAIDAYFGKLDTVHAVTMPAFFASKLAPSWMSGAASLLQRVPGADYFRRSTREVLESCTSNEKLIGVLLGQWGDYGAPPAKSAFAMHALVASHYLDGGNFPVGGSSEIARSIEPTIEKSGGAVVVDADVAEILIDKQGARGVRMADGREIRAGQVISAAGFFTTCMKLLPEDVRRKYGFEEQTRKVQPSIGHLGLYIGLDGSPSELQLPKNNFWIYPGYDHDANMAAFETPDDEFPIVYISFPSSKDPSWEARYPGKSTIEVVSPVPFEWFEQWEREPWRKRGPEYEAFKKKLSDRLLEHVFARVPQARGRVAYHELSTPLSTAHFCNYSRGEVYGLEHTPDRFAQAFLRPATPIKNFYMTGQDTLFCGVGSALFAGILTSSVAMGAKGLAVLPDLLRGQDVPKLRAATDGKKPEKAKESAGGRSGRKLDPAPIA